MFRGTYQLVDLIRHHNKMLGIHFLFTKLTPERFQPILHLHTIGLIDVEEVKDHPGQADLLIGALREEGALSTSRCARIQPITAVADQDRSFRLYTDDRTTVQTVQSLRCLVQLSRGAC